MPVGGRVQQNRAQLPRGDHVDLCGRRHDGNAVDYYWESDARHLLPPPAQDADRVRGLGGSARDERGRQLRRTTSWLLNRAPMLLAVTAARLARDRLVQLGAEA